MKADVVELIERIRACEINRDLDGLKAIAAALPQVPNSGIAREALRSAVRRLEGTYYRSRGRKRLAQRQVFMRLRMKLGDGQSTLLGQPQAFTEIQRSVLAWWWSNHACFQCGGYGACEHREPAADLQQAAQELAKPTF